MPIKLIAVLVLAGHGIGHMMAPQAAFLPPGALPRDAHGLVAGATIVSGPGRAMSLLWLVPMVGFVVASYGFWTDAAWWRPLMAVSAVVSIVAVLPWWNVMPAFSYLGALGVDVLVLVALATPWGDHIIRSVR
jgi:hypothetical protein